ncbi:MAG: peptidoglycan DD-metalloendopeptidase family protein [Bacteroidia bacterium]|nr:peptidoglycan DD-metalloendopeptidase family protein [Bacteroidia bacterium]
MLLGFILTFEISSAQNITNLEKQRIQKEKEKNQLHKDIELGNKLLEETKKTKSVSLNQLQVLNKQIQARKRLIHVINSEIVVLNKQIVEINEVIKSLERDLQSLKDEYAKMIYHAYKNKDSYSRLMFLFAAEDFKQAYHRLKYLQQFSHHRKTQAKLIIRTKESLSNKVSDLEFKKNEKNELLKSKQLENRTLKVEKTNKTKLISNLKAKESELKKEIQAKQRAAQRLNKAIEDIIRKEIESRRKKKEIDLTPEAKALSNKFETNKGKLPWPVEKGLITGVFGKQSHPVLKGIEINNNGIDIKTNKGSEVRAIFDGTVTGVVSIPGANKAVIIRHGEYLSVYSNLKKVYVNRGDKVSTKEHIGLVHTNNLDGNAEVHFEIWKNTTKLNPALWIYIK